MPVDWVEGGGKSDSLMNACGLEVGHSWQINLPSPQSTKIHQENPPPQGGGVFLDECLWPGGGGGVIPIKCPPELGGC